MNKGCIEFRKPKSGFPYVMNRITVPLRARNENCRTQPKFRNVLETMSDCFPFTDCGQVSFRNGVGRRRMSKLDFSRFEQSNRKTLFDF